MSVSRRQARETSFQFLYGALPTPKSEISSQECLFKKDEFDVFCGNFEREEDLFSWELVQGTGKMLPALDGTIRSLSTNWRIERMPQVDVTVLRMAIYEILYLADIPKTVSINEAIELAKKYGAEDSPAFVNGILDKIEKKPLE